MVGGTRDVWNIGKDLQHPGVSSAARQRNHLLQGWCFGDSQQTFSYSWTNNALYEFYQQFWAHSDFFLGIYFISI